MIGWFITRLLMLVILASFERFVVGDVFYYHRKINALFTVGLDRTLFEYPTPVVWILWLPLRRVLWQPRRLSRRLCHLHARPGCAVHLCTLASNRAAPHHSDRLLADLRTADRSPVVPALRHAAGRARRRALLAARRKPWVTGALTGLGAAIKLWPALLIGAFCPIEQIADRQASLS